MTMAKIRVGQYDKFGYICLSISDQIVISTVTCDEIRIYDNHRYCDATIFCLMNGFNTCTFYDVGIIDIDLEPMLFHGDREQYQIVKEQSNNSFRNYDSYKLVHKVIE